jgi:hypothetical protein
VRAARALTDDRVRAFMQQKLRLRGNLNTTRKRVGKQLLWSSLLCVELAACGGGDPPVVQCVENLPTQCTPSLNTDFDSIYTKVLAQSCGVGSNGAACHGATGLSGGLGLQTEQIAYDDLLNAPGRPRVVPGDPKCSILMERIESSDASFRMPLGDTQLTAGVRCAIQTWIQNGAPR